MSSESDFISLMVKSGLTKSEAEGIYISSTIQQQEELVKQITEETIQSKPEPKSDGFINALILAGFSSVIASGISQILSDDEEVVRLILAGKTPLLFMTKQDSKVDDKICLPKQGEVWAKDDPQRPRIPSSLHPNCVLPDTLIEGCDGILAGIRSVYYGPVIDILTSNGSSLTVTPNHLLLTPKGFVAADFLRKGDQIINSSNTKRKMFPINPNNNRKPTIIKQIFDSLSKSFSMSTTTVPSAPKYLHDDARFSHGNIDIVSTNSFLSNTCKPSFFKHVFTHFLNRCNSCLVPLSRQRTITQFLETTLSPSDRIMSGTRKTSSLFSGRLRHTQIHGGTFSSGGNTICQEMFSDVSSTTLKNISKCIDRFSSIIQLDEIININVKSYSGYVYDLQTKSTLYTGNGIILSNCRCNWQDPITGRNLGQF